MISAPARLTAATTRAARALDLDGLPARGVVSPPGGRANTDKDPGVFRESVHVRVRTPARPAAGLSAWQALLTAPPGVSSASGARRFSK